MTDEQKNVFGDLSVPYWLYVLANKIFTELTDEEAKLFEEKLLSVFPYDIELENDSNDDLQKIYEKLSIFRMNRLLEMQQQLLDQCNCDERGVLLETINAISLAKNYFQ